MNVAPTPTSSATAVKRAAEAATGTLEADDGYASGADAENENEVSLVAVLCGTVECEPGSMNNVRVANQSPESVEETSDKILDPFYRPSTASSSTSFSSATSAPEEQPSDNSGGAGDGDGDGGALEENAPMNVSEGGKEITAESQPHSNVGRNAAIGATVAVVIIVLFIFYLIRSRAKRRRRRLMLAEQEDDRSNYSAGSTTFLPLATPAPAGQAAPYRAVTAQPPVPMPRLETDQTATTMPMSPFASPLPPSHTATGTRPEMVQLPNTPSRNGSAAAGQRRRPPPPPPPPRPPPSSSQQRQQPGFSHHTRSASITGSGFSPPTDTSYASYYPPPPALIRQHSLILAPGRQRAATFSEIPGDELPPYVDPIEEAIADSDSPTTSSHRNPSSSADPRPNSPPPYHTIDLPPR